jgi:hypothetical protein
VRCHASRRVFVVHESVEVDQFHPSSDAAGATEIQNACFSRHAGASKDNGSCRTGKKCREGEIVHMAVLCGVAGTLSKSIPGNNLN